MRCRAEMRLSCFIVWIVSPRCLVRLRDMPGLALRTAGERYEQLVLHLSHMTPLYLMHACAMSDGGLICWISLGSA